jgi:hypothetical protein
MKKGSFDLDDQFYQKDIMQNSPPKAKVRERNIDMAHVYRNEDLLSQIDELLYGGMNTKKLFNMKTHERVNYMNSLHKRDRDAINNLIESLQIR